VHVARLPWTHVFCPCEQLSLQVEEHDALGAAPEQVWPPEHIEVDLT
jgi:hypothetical protein